MNHAVQRCGALAVVAALGLTMAAQVAAADQGSCSTDQLWRVTGGHTIFEFKSEALQEWGLAVGEARAPVTAPMGAPTTRVLPIEEASTFKFTVSGQALGALRPGHIRQLGDLSIWGPNGEVVLSTLHIFPSGHGSASATWLAKSGTPGLRLELHRSKFGFDPLLQAFVLRSGELRVSPELAQALGDAELATQVIGSVTIEADVQWVGGMAPADAPPERPAGESTSMMVDGCDMTFCQLYGLYMPAGARVDDIVGLSLGTTSWNLGNQDCLWFPIPNEEHPFIIMNLYRLKDDRFEQIGQSHIKHGFYALGSHQCGGPDCSFEPGHSQGNWLGQNCTDTYGAGLNAVQSGMGPRYEVNPWTGEWTYTGSHMALPSHSHDGIIHRMQVYDYDLEPFLNPGALYFAESFYCMMDDVDVITSFAWKPVTITGGSSGGTWSFGMTGSGEFPFIGPAMKGWTTATQRTLAQEIPVVEFQSPDGRSLLGYHASEVDADTWHYEYALMNIDMDRQVGAFSIPLGPNIADLNITNVGFHAVHHHDEPFNSPEGVPIDNAPWEAELADGAITWSTTSNPIRWGTMYNFRFDADSPPVDATVTLGLFKPGTPDTVTGLTKGPQALECPDPSSDLNSDAVVNAMDLALLLGSWGTCTDCCPADLNADNVVDASDLALLLGDWGPV